jgi:hypothetical protein
MALQGKSFGHCGDHERLGDGLADPNRKGLVRIGLSGLLGRNEEVARSGGHGIEHALRRNPTRTNLTRNHFSPRGFETVFDVRDAIHPTAHASQKLPQAIAN